MPIPIVSGKDLLDAVRRLPQDELDAFLEEALSILFEELRRDQEQPFQTGQQRSA